MKKLIFGILLLPLLTACIDNDSSSSDNNQIDIATVENPTQSSLFYFRLDNGDLMWTSTSDLSNYRPKDGQRIIANYTILSKASKDSSYNQNVRLNDVYEVLTKNIFNIKPQQQDSIGNDQIGIKSMWIGSDYLNVEFVYSGYNKTHFINLVSDNTKTYSDNKIHLEFRHNANDDSPSSSLWGMVSFNLKSLQAGAATDSIHLVIHTREYTTPADNSYSLTYKFKAQSSASSVKKLSFPTIGANNIH